MKRISAFLVGISLLLTSLSLGISLNSALAMSNSTVCQDNSFPAPYTGGADVAKFFHLPDGSTVTITDTGAVIKQSPCHTAYREGWINVADICNIQTGQDLKGQLGSGSSNPFGSATFTGCNSTTQTTQPARPQFQATPAPTANATANATATVNVTTPALQAAKTTTTTTQNAAATKTLPDTGPGNILMLSGATSAIGTLGHLYYSRRRR